MDAYTARLINAEMTTFELLRAVGQALHRDMQFDDKATTVDTSPEEAFTGRRYDQARPRDTRRMFGALHAHPRAVRLLSETT